MILENIMSIFINLLFIFTLYSSLPKDNYYGTISLPLGQVYVQKMNTNEWIKAGYKMQVFRGDKIKTLESSRCEIKITNNKLLRIDENTILELHDDSNRSESALIKNGKMWLNFVIKDKNEEYNVKTPTSVCAIRGTTYRLDCDSLFTTYRVYSGTITITPIEGKQGVQYDTTLNVNDGEELTIVNNFKEYKKIQEKLFLDFQKEQQKLLNEFQDAETKAQLEFEENEEKQFKEFRNKQDKTFQMPNWESFFQYKSLYLNNQKFDRKADSEQDWVMWNMSLDKALNSD